MFKNMREEMQSFIADMKENIKDPETLYYVLNRTEKLFDVILKEVEEIVNYNANELKKLKGKQDEQEKRLQELSIKVKDMYSDIYEEEGEFEIICPYCNSTFESNLNPSENEIICPECDNVIELDWDDSDET